MNKLSYGKCIKAFYDSHKFRLLSNIGLLSSNKRCRNKLLLQIYCIQFGMFEENLIRKWLKEFFGGIFDKSLY